MPSAQVFSQKDGAVYTTSNGAPVAEPYAAERVGSIGPLLIQGTYISRIYSERINLDLLYNRFSSH